MKTLSLLILFTIKTKGFEITGGSDDPLIAAGEQLELNCEIDGHFDFCQWSYSDAWNCLTFSNAIDEELPCEDQERGTITASEGACTLVLEDIALDDIGEYTCMSAKIDGIEVQKSVKLFNVDVAMPASIEFGGDIADVEENWMLLEDEEVTFSCHGKGGTPAAEISGFIGSEEEINEDEDEALDENSSEEEANFDDDRLMDASKEFTFTPSRDNCGQYLKCSAKQFNGDGDLLFEDIPQISKKIMVVFPPKPHDEVHSAGFNEETGESFDLEIMFESHPAPSDEQVIWYLGENTIHAGEDLDDKFTAHALEMGEDDWVIARLTVNYLTAEDAELSYQLSAENDFSSEPVFYDFGLEFNAKPIPTTTTSTTTTTTTQESREIKYMTIRPNVQAEGIGGGSIAAIIIIIIVILISGGCIMWLKKNEMLCFAVYEEVDQKPDIENGDTLKQTPIVKA